MFAGPSTFSLSRGAGRFELGDGTSRMFFGTDSTLYEYKTPWSDVSRGGGYSLASTSRWSFAQFGSTSIAANIDTTIQTSAPGVNFADQATAPKAAIVETVLSSGGGFVMAFNTIDGTYGTRTNAWWCCAANDVTSWTPSIARQCGTGQLIGVEGPIIAAKQFGTDMIIAYKESSFYVGRYVGGDVIWSWQEYPGYGCIGPDAVANLGFAHFVVGQQEIYIFDGARVTVLGQEFRNTDGIFMTSTSVSRNLVRVMYERYSSTIWIFYTTTSNLYQTDKCLVYNTETKRWGKSDRTVGPVLESRGNRLILFTPSGGSPSYSLYRIEGDPGSSSFRVNWFGDDSKISMLTEAALRYDMQSQTSIKYPTTASIQGYYSIWMRNSATTGPTATASDDPGSGKARFTIRQSGRWHNLVFNLTGPYRVVGFDVKLTPVGGNR